MYLPYMPFYRRDATMCSLNDLETINATTTHITVSNNCGNEIMASGLYFTRFTQLQEIVIGDNCFMNVGQVNLIGLSKLTRVVIGMNSFTKKKNGYGEDPNRRFYVKNCPSLIELRIDRYSFSDYGVCEIENANRLEVLEVGDLNQESYNFYSVSVNLMRGR